MRVKGLIYSRQLAVSCLYVLYQAELHEIAEIPDPDAMSLSERREARKDAEDMKFDEEYYL